MGKLLVAWNFHLQEKLLLLAKWQKFLLFFCFMQQCVQIIFMYDESRSGEVLLNVAKICWMRRSDIIRWDRVFICGCHLFLLSLNKKQLQFNENYRLAFQLDVLNWIGLELHFMLPCITFIMSIEDDEKLLPNFIFPLPLIFYRNREDASFSDHFHHVAHTRTHIHTHAYSKHIIFITFMSILFSI